jgi:ribonuclease BN (tRNA processing enzyme)
MSARGGALRFLGVGGASAIALGNSAAAFERDGQPELLIDCGFTAPQAFAAAYGATPPAIFLTHLHLDHCGGLETLFYQLRFGATGAVPPRLFVPAPLVVALQQRFAASPALLAEGGSNFFDVFQLVPVGDGFWWRDLWYHVFPVRHHAPASAFGLHLAGRFLYTGDTRPIPEMLAHRATGGERVFHDCALHGNPSHSGIEDLRREYPPDTLARLVLYHYGSESDAQALTRSGLRVAVPGECFEV